MHRVFRFARIVICSLAILAGGRFAHAQDTAAADDAITRQASTLESDLAKFKTTAPEAAEVLVKLIDLYHQHGRVFGLVRAGQMFTAAHASDPRHEAMMLKLIDGLEAMSRNKDEVTACREFLARYPNSGKAAEIEQRLAYTLDQLNDLPGAADAWRTVYRRQKGTPLGRNAGASAIARFDSSGDKAQYMQSGELASEMLDSLPAGSFAERIAWKGFGSFRRGGEWAKANVLATKLLKSNQPTDPKSRREWHRYMAENYSNLGQHANAAESLKQVRALGDDATTLHQLVMRMYYAGAKAGEIAPLAAEYQQKHAALDDRFVVQSYLAHAYLRDGDKANGLRLLAELIRVDASTNSNAQAYQQQMGNEPAQVAECERVLREALGQNKRDPHVLRYVLAFNVYRDALKDVERAKQMARELLTQSPSDDGYTSQAIDWLLYTVPDDANFENEVRQLIAARNRFIHLGAYRQMLPAWSKQARGNKDHKHKGEVVQAELVKADADPFVQLWLKQTDINHPSAVNLRKELLGQQYFGKLDDAQAMTALRHQNEYYRHQAPGNERHLCVNVSAQAAQRFPTNFGLAARWLEEAVDYNNGEASKLAAQHLLKLEPVSLNAELWRRLMWAADKNNDAELVKQSFAWIQKGTQKFGRDPGYASYIGDMLQKYQLPPEATAYWTLYTSHDPQHPESRECAIRLLGAKKDAERTALLQELLKHDSDAHGRYATYLAYDYFNAGNWDAWEKTVRESRKRQDERPYSGWDFDEGTAQQWVDHARSNEKIEPAVKQRIYQAVADLKITRSSASAELALLEIAKRDQAPPLARLLAYQHVTRLVGNDAHDWDRLQPYAQALMNRKDYVAAGALATAMLANVNNLDAPRAQAGRDMVAQSYARIGGVGLTIDESSPSAPLMQAALYLRLGDERLAFEAYAANVKLF
ncbi:MAG TPA: hypothetical protein VL096_08790, partial [Pirellulaceae bacterium]|nr:hypothetical protein [Pirellulaceae bacterium]